MSESVKMVGGLKKSVMILREGTLVYPGRRGRNWVSEEHLRFGESESTLSLGGYFMKHSQYTW